MAPTQQRDDSAAEPTAAPAADGDNSTTEIVPLDQDLLPVPDSDPVQTDLSDQQQSDLTEDEEVDKDAARLRFTNREGEDKSYLELSLQTLTSMYDASQHDLAQIVRDIEQNDPYPALRLWRQELEACENKSASQVNAYNFAVMAVKTLAKLKSDDLRQTCALIGSAMYHFHKGPAERVFEESRCKDLAESMDIKSERNAEAANKRTLQRLKDRRVAIARQAAADVGTRTSGSHRSRRRRLN